MASIIKMKNPYPSIDFEEAYKWIARLKDTINSTKSVDRATLRSSMGLPPSSGVADNVIGSLTHYGLIDRPKKSSYKISDQAFQLLASRFRSSEWQFLAVKAATHPELFNYLYEKYAATLPVDIDEVIVSDDREVFRNVNRENVSKILDLYNSSLKFSGVKNAETSIPEQEHSINHTTDNNVGAFIDVDLGDGVTIRVAKKILLEAYEKESQRIREKLLG